MDDAQTRSSGGGLAPLAAMGAAVAVGRAVQISNGNLHDDAIWWLSLALALTAGAVALAPLRWRPAWLDDVTVSLGALALAWQVATLLTNLPGIYLRLSTPADLVPFYSSLALAAVMAGAGLSHRPTLRWLLPPALVLAFWWSGSWLLEKSPSPFIDVYVFQQEGAQALLKGLNPYALRYRDIYGNSPFYGEGVSVNGVLQFGFPYPPLSLLLTLPAYALKGDYRWTQLLAMAATALLLAFGAPGRRGFLAAGLLLLTPRVLFVLEQGWTEPLVVLGLALTVASAVHAPRALPYLLGAFLVTKQYLLFALPLAYLLWRGPWPTRQQAVDFTVRMVGTGAVLTLPLALWSPQDFWNDVVALQVKQPFRTEALSYLAWWNGLKGERLPTWLAFLGATLALGLAAWRLPRHPASYALGCALVYLVFFALNKQAFCNYYYFTIGALCVALAYWPAEESPPPARA